MTFRKGYRPWNKGKEIGESHPQMGFQEGNCRGDNPNTKSTQFKKGIHISPKTEFQKGHVPQLENRRSFKGSANPSWKGGIEFRKVGEKKHLCSKYKTWMLEVKNRDNWTCRIIDENCKGLLEAHHILNWVDFPELRYKLNNGITLCQAHHPRKWAEEQRLTPYFMGLITEQVKQI